MKNEEERLHSLVGPNGNDDIILSIHRALISGELTQLSPTL
jgi:hypothetical protein